MKSKLNILLYAGLAVFFGMQLWIRFGAGEKGDTAPNFSTELVSGTEFELEELRGNYVVLDFWGSWCRPCLAENPRLVALYEKYKHRQFTDAEGFKVVTVALEKSKDVWQLAAQRAGFSWEHQIVQNAQFVMMSGIANKYGVTSIPSKFLIGPDGTLLTTDQSLAEIDQILAGKVRE